MAATLTDVFSSDNFSVRTLTDAIDKLPYQPSLLGAMGIFEEQGVPGTFIEIEERAGELTLLTNKVRGGVANQISGVKRKTRSFACGHLPVEDTVLADDVLNVRQFGSNDPIAGPAVIVNDRLAAMKQAIQTTLEWYRLGAIKGIIIDGDNATTLYNLFTEFGLPTPADIDFVLGTSTTDVLGMCNTVARQIEEALGMATIDHIHALCGSQFFDKLVNHDRVRATYLNWQEASVLRKDNRGGFVFGDIVWQEYRGKIGGVPFVGTNEARLFPVGVRGLYKMYYGCANFMETVGTIGLPMYAKQQLMDFDMGARLHVQSNPLAMCTRPAALRKAITSN